MVAAHGVAVRVGTESGVDTSPSTNISTLSCTTTPTGNTIGSLVVVPTQSPNDSIGISVVLGTDRDPNVCDPRNPQGCIVARRAIGYIPHQALELPIVLQRSCVGIGCPQGQTCDNGACVSEVIVPAECTGGTCSLGDAGGVDAGQDADAGPCNPSTLATDPHNCGKCGVDCSGGACSGGVCTLAPAFGVAPGAGACIGVSSDAVYFSTGNVNGAAIYSIPPSGGVVSVVKFASVAGGAFGIGAATTSPTAFGALDSDVYALKSATLTSLTQGPYGPVATDGLGNVCAGASQHIECSGVAAVTIAASPVKIVMNGTVAYFTATDGTINAVSYATTASPVTVNTFIGTSGIALGLLTTVYVATGTSVLAVDVSNGAYTVAATGLTNARGIAYDTAANMLYITDSGFIYSVQPGGSLNTLASGQTNPDCIAIDTSAVYWLNNGVPTKVAR